MMNFKQSLLFIKSISIIICTGMIESGPTDRILTTYEPKSQKLIKQSNQPNPWVLSIRFCKFIKKMTSQDQEYKCERIRIKISFESPEQAREMKKAIMVHAKYCSPYIQTYYEVFIQNKYNKLISIEAKPYLYTLEEVLLICREQNFSLPPGTVTFIRASLIQMYKYILYLLNSNEKVKELLRYDICTNNLAFNSDYRLILINPCISQVNKLNSHLSNQSSSPNCVNGSLRMQIKHVIEEVKQRMFPMEIFDDEDRGLLNFLKTEKKKEFKIQDEMRRMYTWSCVEESQIPQSLFRTLKLELEPKIAFQKQFFSNLESKPLIEYFKKKEQSLITDLKLGKLKSSISSC